MRLANALIGLVVCLALAAGSAAAQNDPSQNSRDSTNDRPNVQLDYVPLRLPGFDSDVARRLIIIIDGQLFGTDLQGRVLQRDENRIDLEGVPLLGDLTRFAYSGDMFTAENFAGSAGLVADTLILNIGVAPDRRPWLDEEALRRLAGAVIPNPLVQQPDLGNLTVQTVVVLNEDQSFAIGGIYTRPLAAQPVAPAFADIPIIGSLFTVRNTDNDTTELLVVVPPTIFTD